jgi:hypothetical protein
VGEDGPHLAQRHDEVEGCQSQGFQAPEETQVTGRTERTSAAQAILAIPLFDELMDELETYEINCAVAAPYENHEARQGHMAALKAIRNLRLRIGAIANEGQPSGGKKAPA